MCSPENEVLVASEVAPEAKSIPSVSLGVLAAIIKKTKLTICNESGASQIASAMLRNQIIIFDVTNSKKYKISI